MRAITALAILLLSTTQLLALSPVEKDILSKGSLDSALLWGTYKSMLLHAVSQVTPVHNPVSFSMALMPDTTAKDRSKIKYKVKDMQESSANTFVDFEMHNGYSFGHQKIIDPSANINMTNSFVKTDFSTMTNQSWLDLTRVFSQSKSRNAIALEEEEYTNVFFAVTLESYYNNETSYLDFDPKTNQIVVNKANGVKEYFRYSLFKNGGVDATVPYFKIYSGMNRTSNWQVADWTAKGLELDASGKFVKLPSNLSELNKDSSLIILQFRLAVGTSYDILFEYSSTGLAQTAPTLSAVLALIESAKNNYMVTLQSTFTAGSLSKNESGLLKSCISNLLGGLTYEYGPIVLYEDDTPQPHLPLFTGTPARNAFPHAFLWDEGFHNLLFCRWSPKLCMRIMSSWFNTQYKTGWIAREQVRGPESEDTVPGSFLKQSIYEGNPPTFIIAILWVLENVDPSEGVTAFIEDIYSKVTKWHTWFYESQAYHDASGQNLNLFKWSKFLGSGLDDYPRDDPGADHLYSVDLQVWEIVFARCMKEVATLVGKGADAQYYAAKEVNITANLRGFLDPKDQIYKDILQMNATAKLSGPDQLLKLIMRRFKGTVQVPSSHIGYVSFFPLMFGLVPDNSQELNALLDLIDINGVEIAPWGILSLNRNDTMYEKNSNYWTSPVWINCNYMILKAIKTNYPNNQRAMRVYDNVRRGLIQNVIDNWVRTGFIWENYNARTGAGQGNHPFTGWSTLMALMVSEDY